MILENNLNTSKNFSTTKRVLSQARIGEKVKIISFAKSLETKATLISMGIILGDELEVMSKSPFGSPISFKHGENSFFALRSNQASLIEIE